jgi:hypothetical protein
VLFPAPHMRSSQAHAENQVVLSCSPLSCAGMSCRCVDETVGVSCMRECACQVLSFT